VTTSPTRRPHIVLLIPVWGRPKLTTALLLHLMRCRKVVSSLAAFVPIVIGSEGSTSKRPSRKAQIKHYLEVPFGPLGQRLNAGLAHARELVPHLDGVVVIGATDFLPISAFKAFRRAALNDAPLVGFADFFGLSQSNYQALYTVGEVPVRPGRYYGRETLDALDWSLWEDTDEDATSTPDDRVAGEWTLNVGKKHKAAPVVIVPDLNDFMGLAMEYGENASSAGYFDVMGKFLGDELVAEVGMMQPEALPLAPGSPEPAEDPAATPEPEVAAMPKAVPVAVTEAVRVPPAEHAE